MDISYKCDVCKKYYINENNLLTHMNKYHNNNIIENGCKYCNKKLANRYSRWRHEQKCKIKKENKINKDNTLELKNLIIDLQKQMNELINNQKPIILNNNSNNNNKTIINNTYVKFGNENLSEILSKKDMYHILSRNCFSIEESIKKVHFNKNLPEYNNIFITNMKDSVAYIFNGLKFILISKDDVIYELFRNHLDNIELFIEKAEILPDKYKRISKFLKAINNEDQVYINEINKKKKYSNYKAYKLDLIKQLIYNNSNKKNLHQLNNINLIEKE